MGLSFRNLKIRYQVMISFLLVYFVLLIGSGILFYYMAAGNVMDNFEKSAKNAIGQIENTLKTRLDIIEVRAKTMLTTPTFFTALQLQLRQPDAIHLVRAQGSVGDYLRDFERGERLVRNSAVYAGPDVYDSYFHYRNHDFSFYDSRFFKIYTDEHMNAVQWLPAMRDEIFQGGARVVPCVRRFTVPEYPGHWEYLVYQLDVQAMSALISGDTPFFEDIVIFDAQGHPILGQAAAHREALMELWTEAAEPEDRFRRGELTLDGASYVVDSCELSANGWRVFGLKSKTQLLHSLKKLRLNILRVAAVLFAFSILVILVTARQLTDALSRLEEQMSRVQRGDFEVRFFYPFNNEIGSLSRSFNYMIEEIQQLVRAQERNIEELRLARDRVERVQKQKRKAELQALQAQINPHFLYNTLNTITWQAADQGMEDVSLMASSLGRFFRIGLSKGNEIISLGDELEHVRAYLNIQGIRYQNKLRYEICADTALLGLPVLKLILQPLVENAIYHGIKEKKQGGEIRIDIQPGLQDGRRLLRLSVYDNGAGIAAAKLTEINRCLRAGDKPGDSGYGIYNVNERIMLYYGVGYGLKYESEAGVFTRATIRIPAQLSGEDGERDV